MRPRCDRSSGSRLPGIEGLGAIAACSILVYHTRLYSPPARAARILDSSNGTDPLIIEQIEATTASLRDFAHVITGALRGEG